MIDLNLIYEVVERFPLISLMIVGGTTVSFLGLLLRKMMSRSSAAQRHLILYASVVGLFVLPLIHLAGPDVSLPIVPVDSGRSVPVPPVQVEPAETSVSSLDLRTEPSITTERETPVADLSSLPGPRALLLMVYVAGIVMVLVPIVAGTLRMRWLVSRAEPLPDADEFTGGLTQHLESADVEILTSDAVRVPLAWGWRRAILLLPSEAVDWPREMKQDAIVHELAHLDRRDLLSQTVARLAVAIHWFNPLAWVVLRRLLLEAEQACDDRVLAAGAGTADYAERLLRIASGANHPSLRGLSAVAMARSSQLATRIEALFESSRARSGRLGTARMIATFVVILVPTFILGAVQLQPRVSSAEPDAQTKTSVDRFADRERSESTWATVVANELRVEPGHTAEISGLGVIRFRDGRRTVLPEDGGIVLVNGSAPDPTSTTEVRRNRVEIIGPGSSRWVLRSYPNEKLSDSGTRIYDSDSNATARIDTTVPTTFYIQVDTTGRTEYFKPDRTSSNWKADISSRWSDSGDADESPLHAAILRGSVSMVEALLDSGADPNARWDGDGTPLIIAVRQEEPEIVDLLLSRGARPDLGVEGDGNALIVAAARGDLWSLDRFIATGADIDRGVLGDGNPLIAAAGHGQLDAMKLLVSHGADLEVVVPGDENALITAAGTGHLEAVRYLVSVGANVNSAVEVRSWRTGRVEVRTPLSRARESGHDEIVRYLRSVGARD